MFGNPYINPQINIERIDNQIRELQNIRNQYTSVPQHPQQPINNIINTQVPTQTQQQDIISMRVLNEGEDVSNLFVQNKTVFINDKNMVIKSPDGKLEKYDILKTYPIDPKDQKINELEKQIQELKGMIGNEQHTKLNKPVENVEQSTTNDNVDVESTTKTSGKSISSKSRQ